MSSEEAETIALPQDVDAKPNENERSTRRPHLRGGVPRDGSRTKKCATAHHRPVNTMNTVMVTVSAGLVLVANIGM